MLALAGCIDAPESSRDGDAAPDGDDDAAAMNQLLVNPGFEEGVGVGWIFQPGGAPRISTADDLGVQPQGGDYVAEVGDSDNTNEVISQLVDVPEGVTSLTINFHRCVLTEEPMDDTAKAWDFCNVRSSDGGELETLLQQANDEATLACEWEAASVAVASFTAGAPLEILLIANNDSSDPTRCLYDSFELIPTY